MRAPVSVIIPTLDAADQIGPTLVALVEGLTAGLIRELIIVDGGSSDDIEAAAEEAGAVFLRTEPGRGVQLAEGATAAKGDWLLFLHADTRLAPGWPKAAAQHILTAPDRAGWFRLRFDATGLAPTIVAGWANIRARLGLPYGDQGLLVARKVYEAAGGYDRIPLMEDVALARRLPLRPIPAEAVTSAERYLREGWIRRGWRNLTILALYFTGTDIERLVKRYDGV
jgi:rSAM/selenodomain-associated transferase 2